MKHFTSKTQKIGEKGEEEACKFLVGTGFSILERNASNKFGEIDIVGKKEGVHYFFEVKAGKKDGFINPAENLTKEKLRKFFISIEHYCFLHHIKIFKAQGVLVTFGAEGEVCVECIDLF